MVEDIIEAASRFIDTFTGRTFYARTETHVFDIPDGDELWLDDDLLTVTSITNGDGTAIVASTDYLLLPANKTPKYAVRLRDSTDTTWEETAASSSEQAITIIGTWGYAATAPDDVKQSCLQIATNLYHKRFGENASGAPIITGAGVVITPQDIPGGALAALRAYRRTV